MTNLTADTAELAAIVGAANVLTGDAIAEDYFHDESLSVPGIRPGCVVRPASAAEVAEVVRWAADHSVPVTARGSGTGLSGACVPVEGGILLSFERMADILEIDLANHVAVVQPGVTLEQLDIATAAHGLIYPVSPGESSASLGGNVATNAGGMRAVKYGVTRHQVLGIEAVLGTGEVIRCGGKYVKATTGYDLTQLVIGSEGTLAIVTEAILRLYPRAEHACTLLAPFLGLEDLTDAVPIIVGSGLGPLVVEYIDLVSLAGITRNAGLELGVRADIKEKALAYLVVVLEGRDATRLDEDVSELAGMLDALGALDVYVLPPQAGTALIEAREKAFWAAKANGADDIIDMVVPRAAIATYMTRVGDLAKASASLVVGCGHAGDGNVHLSIWQSDVDKRTELLHDIFRAGRELGGTISGEHGIGLAKKEHFLVLEDPAKVALMRRIKTAFDPAGILNPGTIFDTQEAHV